MTPTLTLPAAPISPLRQRLIEDMNMRRFAMATQRGYIRAVARFAAFLGRPPDTATTEDVRRFQIEQREAGVPAPMMNSIVSALRFFFAHTLDRPDLARKLYRVPYPCMLPIVLSPDEVARLLQATTCLMPQAPGGAVGRLRRGLAGCRGRDAQGARRRQRAHVAESREGQRRSVPQCAALG